MLNKDRVKFARLSVNTPGIDQFKNTEGSMVDYIQNEALVDQDNLLTTTWTWTYEDRILLGFMSLAMHSIDIGDIPENERSKYGYAAVPSLLIGHLATHRDYEGKGIGSDMVQYAISLGYQASDNYGCKMLVLHPLSSVISWYEKKTPFRMINKKKGDIMHFRLELENKHLP